MQYSLTSIKGVGRRFSNLICKKAEVDPNKRCVCQVKGLAWVCAGLVSSSRSRGVTLAIPPPSRAASLVSQLTALRTADGLSAQMYIIGILIHLAIVARSRCDGDWDKQNRCSVHPAFCALVSTSRGIMSV